LESFQDNESAFEKAYDEYAGMLYRLSLSHLNNQEDAEDAVQDVFIKFLDSAHKIKDQEHERAWLVRVTINTCVDRIRRLNHHAKVSIDDIEEPRSHDVDLNTLLFTADCSDSLPFKIKTAVLLHYLEGYSIKEVASMLGISIPAAKMRLSRGRKLMKQYFEKEERHV